MNMFDIVIPLGPNDYDQIEQGLELNKENVTGYDKIYVITKKTDIKLSGCTIIDENIFPFSIESIKNIIKFRPKWYFQQLIKLYAGIYVPSIKDRYLVIDADTFFLQPTAFIENNICLYNFGGEYHLPYFAHMKRLHPDLEKMIPNKSGICHHMMFETKYLNELFLKIEKFHDMPFYEAFLQCVDNTSPTPGASEYEIYFNYMLKFYPNNLKIRRIPWKNRSVLNLLEDKKEYNYISYHHYRRVKK